MKIYSNGYYIFQDEEHARTFTREMIERSHARSIEFGNCDVGNIQEKIKTERNGVRHIFFFNYRVTARSKLSIYSYSYLVRTI